MVRTGSSSPCSSRKITWSFLAPQPVCSRRPTTRPCFHSRVCRGLRCGRRLCSPSAVRVRVCPYRRRHKYPVGREMPNSWHSADIRSCPLAARITNCIRCSLTFVAFHPMVSGLLGQKLYSQCVKDVLATSVKDVMAPYTKEARVCLPIVKKIPASEDAGYSSHEHQEGCQQRQMAWSQKA